MSEIYDEDYFMRGKETGKSLYENYRWLPDLTIPMASAMIRHLGIRHNDTILDYGCARGYTVKAFREMGYSARGIDVSEWAIQNADEDTKPYLQLVKEVPPLISREFSWVVAKDVLEHIRQVDSTIISLRNAASVGVFAVVPLSVEDNGRYVVEAYEKDVTHIHRLTLGTWAELFMRPGWSVEASYRVKGIKDSYYCPVWETGNGFIVARRTAE